MAPHRACVSFRNWPCSGPAIPLASVAPTGRTRSPTTTRRGSCALTFINRGLEQLQLTFHQNGRQVEANRVFGQEPGLAVDGHVIAIVLDGQTRYFLHVGSIALNEAHEFELEIDISGLIARGIRIRDV